MNYKQASKTPVQGWKYAEGGHLIAVAARMLAGRHCMSPKAIYEWAVRRCPDLYERLLKEGKKLSPPDTRILMAVLNDTELPNEQEFAYGK